MEGIKGKTYCGPIRVVNWRIKVALVLLMREAKSKHRLAIILVGIPHLGCKLEPRTNRERRDRPILPYRPWGNLSLQMWAVSFVLRTNLYQNTLAINISITWRNTATFPILPFKPIYLFSYPVCLPFLSDWCLLILSYLLSPTPGVLLH